MGTASDNLAKRAKAGKPYRSAGSPVQSDDAMDRVWQNIRQYGLEENVAELETRGLTIVPPEKASPDGFIERLKKATLEFIETQDGGAPDFDTGATHKNQILGDYHYLVLRDPVFQELVCQPVAVALLDYLLGESCIIHANSALCKGPHEDDFVPENELVLALHSDNQLLPGPFHSWAEFANVTWTLTDYTKENGALAYVPGSHLLCRHPLPGEGVDQAIAAEAPAGSIICWHGNTWHGAFRRRNPGIRLSIGSIYSRPYIWPRHPLREDVTSEILEANPPRFAKFCGRHVMTHWREEGPTYGPEMIHAYHTRFH
jgi:hypothetical protein